MKQTGYAKDYQNIREVIYDCTERFADKDAFIIKNKVPKGVKFDTLPEEEKYKHISFKEYRHQIESLGTALVDKGFCGKRVAIIGSNCFEWMLGYYAVVMGVGIVVPLDKGLPDSEIENSITISETDVIFCERSHLEFLNTLVEREDSPLKQIVCFDELPGYVEEGSKLLEAGDTRFLDLDIDNNAMSILLFTSGTTSSAKAVMLSHKNIASNIYGMQLHEDICEHDTNLALLPYHHTFGCTGQLMFLAQGATTAYCDGLRHIQKNFNEYNIRAFFCVPLIIESIHKKVIQTVEKQGKLKLLRRMQKLSRGLMKIGIDLRRPMFKSVRDGIGGDFRLLINGAAALNPDVQRDFNDWGVLAINGYGLTETAPVIAAESPEYMKRSSTGKSLPNVEVKLEDVDENGIGEICARGDNIMLGYYKNQEATDEVLKDGWFHTGDFGMIDSEGYVYITGRKKNVIVLKNGKNIYPEELESTIQGLPYVEENIVFGITKHTDMAIATKIVLSAEYLNNHYPDNTPEEAEAIMRGIIWDDIKKLNKELPSYKHIEYLTTSCEPMVKTTTSKVKKHVEIAAIEKSGELEHISLAK